MSTRGTVRKAVAGLVAGATLVGTAWAGVGLVPAGDGGRPEVPVASEAARDATETLAAATTTGAPDLSHLTTRLPAGEFLVGADVADLTPDGTKWQTEGCAKEDQSQAELAMEHLENIPNGKLPAVGWPKSENCVYLGGFGIGPGRPATGVDPGTGVKVRSIAISNGVDVVVWQIVDMVGFFNKYRDDLCPEGCGILDIRQAIAAATGNKVPVTNIAVGSTHTHGGADGYGAWGGMPSWYRKQIRDTVVQSAFSALGAMQAATIDIGNVDARAFNNERRDNYYSAPDTGLVWMQARALPTDKPKKNDPPPAVIATLVNYAAHPTVTGDGPVLHGDWPAGAAKALGELFGGTGLLFEGGLGNISARNLGDLGQKFAQFVKADIDDGGHRVVANDIKTTSSAVVHPVTNWVEAGGSLANLLDRTFTHPDAGGPGGEYHWAKGASVRGCATAGPLSVKTEVSGFRIGDLTVVTGPGEVFSTMTEVVKSKSIRSTEDQGETMVFAQTQDSLGYIIQSFEVDALGGLPHYGGEAHDELTVGSYEETFMMDRCFGDHVLAEQIAVAGRL